MAGLQGFLLAFVLSISWASAAHLRVNTTKTIFTVDPEFISANLDFALVTGGGTQPKWAIFDPKSPKVVALLRGLTPCYLRFGGSGADLTVFTDDHQNRLPRQPTTFNLFTIFREDIDKLVSLTRATGSRLLYDMNLEVRFFNDWDPTNAERLLSYMASKGYGENIDFEMGNEPAAPPYVPISGKQIGHDYLSLIQLIRSYPNFRQSKVVGCDIVTVAGLKSLMPGFLSIAGSNLSATTFHHYYFNGLNAHPSEYMNPNLFDAIKDTIWLVKELIQNYSPNKDLPAWIGETADAWHGGTPNVSDRYISGFLWLDKLGLAAQLGVSTIMRQTFYGGDYGLINDNLEPNPDYWLSYIHKKLVGRSVFSTLVMEEGESNYLRFLPRRQHENRARDTGAQPHVRLYSHCTKPSTMYPAGALTVFGINLKNMSEVVTFDPELASQPVDQYLLLPGDQDQGLLSQTVMLNGQILHLLNDYSMPTLKPLSLPDVSMGIKFPAQTFGFWVFPKIKIKQCL